MDARTTRSELRLAPRAAFHAQRRTRRPGNRWGSRRPRLKPKPGLGTAVQRCAAKKSSRARSFFAAISRFDAAGACPAVRFGEHARRLVCPAVARTKSRSHRTDTSALRYPGRAFGSFRRSIGQVSWGLVRKTPSAPAFGQSGFWTFETWEPFPRPGAK